MENKKDIGEFFKERFADYSPTPDPKIWKAIESNKKVHFSGKTAQKWGIGAVAGIAIIVGIIYFALPQLHQDTNTGSKTLQSPSPVQEMTSKLESAPVNIWKYFNSETRQYNIFEQIQKYFLKDSSHTKHFKAFSIVAKPDTISLFTKPKETKVQTLLEKKDTIKSKRIARDTAVSDNFVKMPSVSSSKEIEIPVKEVFLAPVSPIQTKETRTENKVSSHNNEAMQNNQQRPLQNNTAVQSNIETNSKQDKDIIQVPNAFTPEGFNNNVFKPYIKDAGQYEMVIYSQKGERIFQTKDLTQGWDGKIRGANAPKGAYIYQIRYTETLSGKSHTKQGVVNLLKD